MKRYGNLFEKITSFDTILSATKKARRGKRFKASTLLFEHNLEKNILEIRNVLRNKTWSPGNYHDFHIYEPKKRLISAAPYFDRIIHHALISIIEPLMVKSFIYDSYSCIKGKGTHKAVSRFKEFMRRNAFVLKCDIKRYFPSIDHLILFEKIADKIKCKDTLWLVEKIIGSRSEKNERLDYFDGDDLFTPLHRKRGLPIGNLTSQFLSNLYLNDFDHFVKETLRAEFYIRYCDDFVIFGNSKQQLHSLKKDIAAYLATLRLKLNETKSRIYRVTDGVDFLGYRIFPDHSLVRKSIVKRYRKKLSRNLQKYYAGSVELSKITLSMHSWIGHIQHADSFRLRQSVFKEVFSLIEKNGAGSQKLARGLVEQQSYQLPLRLPQQQQQPAEQEQQCGFSLFEHSVSMPEPLFSRE